MAEQVAERVAPITESGCCAGQPSARRGHSPGALHDCWGGGGRRRGEGGRRLGRRVVSAQRQMGTMVGDAAPAGRAHVGAMCRGIFTIREAEADCRRRRRGRLRYRHRQWGRLQGADRGWGEG
jgi:hypothetical protein